MWIRIVLWHLLIVLKLVGTLSHYCHYFYATTIPRKLDSRIWIVAGLLLLLLHSMPKDEYKQESIAFCRPILHFHVTSLPVAIQLKVRAIYLLFPLKIIGFQNLNGISSEHGTLFRAESVPKILWTIHLYLQLHSRLVTF